MLDSPDEPPDDVFMEDAGIATSIDAEIIDGDVFVVFEVNFIGVQDAVEVFRGEIKVDLDGADVDMVFVERLIGVPGCVDTETRVYSL